MDIVLFALISSLCITLSIIAIYKYFSLNKYIYNYKPDNFFRKATLIILSLKTLYIDSFSSAVIIFIYEFLNIYLLTYFFKLIITADLSNFQFSVLSFIVRFTYISISLVVIVIKMQKNQD